MPIQSAKLSPTGRRALAAMRRVAAGGDLDSIIATAGEPMVSVGRALANATDFPKPVPDEDWPAVVDAFARLGEKVPASADIGCCCQQLLQALTSRATRTGIGPELRRPTGG